MKSNDILKARAKHYKQLAYGYKQACKELINILEDSYIPTKALDRYSELGEALAGLADKSEAFNEWIEDNTEVIIPSLL